MSDESPLLIEHLGQLSETLRIVFVYDNNNLESNGLDRSTALVVQGLQRRGHEISLIRTKSKIKDNLNFDEDFDDRLIKKSNLVSRSLKLGWPTTTELTNLWLIRRPDLVYVSAEGSLGWSAIKSARKLKIPSVTDIRSKFKSTSKLNQKPVSKLLRGAVMAYLRKFHNSSQRTLVQSNELKRQLTDLGFEHLEVLPYGVDTEMFNPIKRSDALRSSWGCTPSTTVLLYFSQGKKDKHLKWLTQFILKSRSFRTPLKLVVIPSGLDKDSIRVKSDFIHVASSLKSSELSEYLASSDLMIAPSSFESASQEIIESMASGLPILWQSKADRNKVLIDEVNCFMVESDNESEYIHRLLSITEKPELLKTIGSNARQSAMSYEWNFLVENIESIFKSVSKRHPF